MISALVPAGIFKLIEILCLSIVGKNVTPITPPLIAAKESTNTEIITAKESDLFFNTALSAGI